MLKRRMARSMTAGLWILLTAGQVHAYFGCEVVTGEPGIGSVALYEAPDFSSRIVVQVPGGDIVQLPSDDPESDAVEGWSRVRYDPTQEAFWPAGVAWWIRTDNMDYCG